MNVEIVNNSQKQISTRFKEENIEDLLFEFLRDRTKLTERAYRKDLKHFFAFTAQHFGVPAFINRKMHFEDIQRVHIVKYKVHLETTNCLRRKPYAPNSVNRKISAVSSFYQFLLVREIVDRNPAEHCIRPKRLVVEETQAFTDREMKDLFDLVIRIAPPLHKAVILLIFTTGVRQSELRSIKLDDIKENEGIAFLHYIGKGQKKNTMPLHPTALFYVNEYIKHMENIGRKIYSGDYIFQPAKNTYNGRTLNKLSHTAMAYIVGKYAKIINKDKRITPHSARATFISSLIENGEDIYYVSKLVNHSDVRTTQGYDKRKTNFRKNPVFNLNFF